jgi:hypothetical protein
MCQLILCSNGSVVCWIWPFLNWENRLVQTGCWDKSFFIFQNKSCNIFETWNSYAHILTYIQKIPMLHKYFCQQCNHYIQISLQHICQQRKIITKCPHTGYTFWSKGGDEFKFERQQIKNGCISMSTIGSLSWRTNQYVPKPLSSSYNFVNFSGNKRREKHWRRICRALFC